MIVEWVIAGLAILGYILNIKKNKWGFVVWFISNTAWIGIDIIYQLWGQIPLWIVYDAFSVWGWIAWSKEKKT